MTSQMDFGSSFHAFALRKLKDHCPVARQHLTKSKLLQFLVVWLWICEHFLNLCDKYSGAQSLSLSFCLMSKRPMILVPQRYGRISSGPGQFLLQSSEQVATF